MSEIKELDLFGFTNTKPSKPVRSARTYDPSFKKFFSRKEVLAGILLGVIPEFKYSTFEDVQNSIETSEFNVLNAEVLNSEDTEDPQKVIYDILVMVNVPKTGRQEVHLLFDLEMQYDYRPGYPLMNRAVYYTSRLITKQRIEKAKYAKLLPVRSTWISVKNVPRDLQNRMVHITLEAHDSAGIDLSERFDGIDLIGIDFVLLSESYNWNSGDDTTVKFLQSIFNNRLSNREFNPFIEVTSEIESEVIALTTDLDHYNAELDAELEAGRAEGRAKGRAEGRAEGIISTAVKLGVTDIDIISSMLIDELHITKEEANAYIEKYLPSRNA